MRFLQRHKLELLCILGLIILYFLTRLTLLTSLPIFTDEAIYIRWAQVSLHDASWRFISLTDGKQPLLIWVMMPFLKFIPDPLFAGRLVSVATGFFSMVGVWFLSYALFKRKAVAYISSLLYVFYPLALFHDRLAIYDSMVAMWYIWSLYFSILLVRKINLSTSYNLGFLLGASVLTKSGGFISMALLPFLLFLFDFKQKNYKNHLLKVIGLGIVSIVMGLVMYSILRLSPLYGTIANKDTTFIYAFSDWLNHSLLWQWQLFSGNFIGMLQWMGGYMNIMYIVFLIVGLVLGSFWKEKIVLVIYFLLPFMYAAVFGKVLFPRYILFMTDVLLPIIAFGILQAVIVIFHNKKKSMTWGLAAFSLIAVIPTIYISTILITNPLQAPIPNSDKFQYITGWPAGWGVKESIAYLRQQSQNQHIFVGTQGTFGLMPFAFEMYFFDDPNVTTKAYWPIDTTIPADLLQKAKTMPTYIYFYEPCVNCSSLGVAPASWPLTPIFTVDKDNGNVHATLYKVNPQE